MTTLREPKGRSEERDQARLVRWSHLREVRAAMPQLARLHHSPNGGRRDAFTGAQMTALGVKRGWPDLVLPLPPPDLGIAVEMKSTDGVTTKDQDSWLDWFTTCGWHVAVCRSAEDAAAFICAVLDVDPANLPPVPPP
jgi:VRR-NUC domain